MANPTFRTIENSASMPYVGERATLNGTLTKSIALTVLTIISAVLAGYFVGPTSSGMILMMAGIFISFILAMVISFKPHLASSLATGYAIFEGASLGIISAQFEMYYAGISVMAVGITLSTLFLMLYLWKAQIIKVTDKMRSMIFSMTGAIVLFYLIGFVASLLGFDLIPRTGIFGLGISVIVAGVAAFNLLLDFDMIQKSVEAGAPKYMEYYCSFALLVTLIWLYIEVLRMLQIIMSMLNSED